MEMGQFRRPVNRMILKWGHQLQMGVEVSPSSPGRQWPLGLDVLRRVFRFRSAPICLRRERVADRFGRCRYTAQIGACESERTALEVLVPSRRTKMAWLTTEERAR
jgi:hypothetical protein